MFGHLFITSSSSHFFNNTDLEQYLFESVEVTEELLKRDKKNFVNFLFKKIFREKVFFEKNLFSPMAPKSLST